MDISGGSNGSGASSSHSNCGPLTITDVGNNKNCQPTKQQHGNNGRLQSVRKMSTMHEEEDGSDDVDPDVVKSAQQQQYHHPHSHHHHPHHHHHQQQQQQQHHQHQNQHNHLIHGHHRESQQDVDSDSPCEERGRLLSSAGSSRKARISQAKILTGYDPELRLGSSGHSGSTDSVHDRSQPRLHQSRPIISNEQSGRSTRGVDHHVTRHHRYPSMRSLKSNATMDEHHHHYHQHQPPAASWASIVFSDGNGQVGRPFTDSVSIRSLASIGMGSSDGRKLTIRRVPTSPSELLNLVHPPPSIEDDLSTCTSYDDGEGEDPGDYRQPRRPHWANKVQFVLACIGYSVGLGNVWRFPYLCYKSGGGVFLVPYFLILVVCGVPLLYMELSIGQFTRRGPIGALGQICPLFKGAGLSSVVISFLMSTYHNVIIAYAIYYFFAAFRAHQPWSDCDNSWNTAACWLPINGFIDNRTRLNASKTPSEDFFDNKVLQISSGIEEPGALRWELVACLITAWIMVYFSIWKSIKSSAQVRYLTATLPFLLIVVFLTRSLTLEGADKGLQFFFHPRWELLGDAKVWINAAAQIFNSVGIAFGSMICFASYNKFHNTILVDTVAVSLINACSSLLVGIFSFATIGNIAREQNMSVEAVLSDGPGLIFVIYPQALAKMPASQLWAVLFFFMMVCLSLNSQFAIVEVVVTSIQDGFPNWVKRRLLCHEMLVLVICVVSFLFGLPNITQGGIYFFQLIDHYAASLSIMFLAFFEVFAISWCYGVRRLCNNVKEMTGRVPSMYFQFCWLVAAPLLILAVWVFSLIDYEPPTYRNGEYEYPWWAEAIGWGIASLSLICIPAFAIYVFIKSDGNTFSEKLKNSIKPHFEACKLCGQEYCQEPMHNLEEETAKDPQQDMINPIQLNANYLLSKPQS
ncbi:sodium- and chloride-dependent GABA transporter ine isoform X1 [Vespa crabro]|uniref:sodium- and chloride-dependent GABA transporter ine isoform X1 n=1 Tax=Vespa crabro TaxID=7445 RepID=UPI001EFFC5BB|nr:sodium- and chloride-dependent GABA transporter ine isoform X1 [Vespa crabro]XP_046826896.1 sodium- and chloride-dependent GABA transporter ine isoform X1 [Vespa crabro]